MRGEETKECIDCERVLPIGRFNLSEKKWRRSKCEKCRKIGQVYKISGKEFYRMLNEQLHCCLICESPINEITACIDHCHDTGSVRALLCNNCNVAIGMLKHDIEVTYRAVEYLLHHT
jgi:hypothetical protein